MADDQFKLRRVDNNNNNNANGASTPNPSAEEIQVESLVTDAAAPSSKAPAPAPVVEASTISTTAINGDVPMNSSATDVAAGADVDTNASLRQQLSLAQQQAAAAEAALAQGRLAYAALDAKHQQFVEANVAFTHWRDDMERQRASWAEANAKFAKRHEENKAAKANLEAKYAAVVMDLEEVKERYGGVKRELMRVTGMVERSPSPPLPSALRSAGQDVTSGVGIPGMRPKKGSKASVRGVERGDSGTAAAFHQQRPGPYPTFLVEQSVLRERLTSDMFTLSQKVLEERANRAEEARQMAERRIFELESQLATRAQ